jgi:hypothetical protein
MSMQAVPSASQRCHWKRSLCTGTLHSAGVARTTWATWTVPVMAGAVTRVSGRPATSAVKVETAVVETPAAVPVTRTAIVCPTSGPCRT